MGFSVTVPSSVTLTSSTVGAAMTINNVTTSLIGLQGTIGDAGTQTFQIGGTLSVAPNQTIGVYTGTVSIIINNL